VNKQVPFHHKKSINGITFTLYNSNAGCDWDEGTKKGDYFVSIGYNVHDAGGGSPITISEFLKGFDTYENAVKQIDKYLKHFTEYGYTTLENTFEQLTLF
jgi:hypothetical protein